MPRHSPHRKNKAKTKNRPIPLGKPVYFLGILALGLTFGGYWVGKLLKSQQAQLAPPPPENSSPVNAPSSDPGSSNDPTIVQQLAQTAAVTVISTNTSLPHIFPDASNYARALVDYVAAIDLSQGVVTAEQANLWKEGLARLVNEGARALPAIRELLLRDADVSFANITNGQLLGVASLRSAMLDSLWQIGGPESLNLALEILQTTSRPDEVARLARDLEALAPGQYRDASVSAARSTLARLSQAADKQVMDAGPLFEVLRKFGDLSVAPDLEQAAARWNYYGPITLATLPEGAGIPYLVQMASNPKTSLSGGRQTAIRMLAEMSSQYPAAAQALVDQASRSQIPSGVWEDVAAALGGEQSFFTAKYLDYSVPATGTDLKTYHIKANNQNFASVDVLQSWTSEQVQAQLQLVDQIRASAPSVGRTLDGARAKLLARLAQ